MSAVKERFQPAESNEDRSQQLTVIEPRSGWRSIDFGELWRYRDLFYFLVWRDIKARYAQSVLGVSWALIHPLFHMIVFTIVFGNLAHINSDGVPYSVFSATAVVPWAYFSQSLVGAGSSLVGSSNMLTKVYFPRLIIPLTAVLARLVDLLVATLLVVALMVWFRVTPTIWTLALPLFIVMMTVSAAGLGTWFTALDVQYRDVRHALPFGVQLLLFASPIVYPANLIPDQYRLVYALNPMAGVIEGLRSALLATNPMPWDLIAVSGASAAFLLITGTLYFRRAERIFADVV